MGRSARWPARVGSVSAGAACASFRLRRPLQSAVRLPPQLQHPSCCLGVARHAPACTAASQALVAFTPLLEPRRSVPRRQDLPVPTLGSAVSGDVPSRRPNPVAAMDAHGLHLVSASNIRLPNLCYRSAHFDPQGARKCQHPCRRRETEGRR
jgi:hypothetical protein